MAGDQNPNPQSSSTSSNFPPRGTDSPFRPGSEQESRDAFTFPGSKKQREAWRRDLCNGFAGNSNTPTRDSFRSSHLAAVATQSISSVVLLTGNSGAGKTTIAEALVSDEKLGQRFNYGTKLVPRIPERVGSAGDRSWLDLEDSLAVHSNSSDLADHLLMVVRRFSKYYGFSSDAFKTSIQDQKDVVVVLGRPEEAFEMQRSLQKRFPLLPVSVIWLDVSKDALVGRLSQRKERQEGERDRRLREVLRERPSPDLLDTMDAHGILRVVLNESDFEHGDGNSSLSESEKMKHQEEKQQNIYKAVQSILSIRDEARMGSSERARDLLRLVSMHECAGIPDSVKESLRTLLIPALDQLPPEHSNDCCIIGGLAVSMLSGQNGRLVSPDIDLVYHHSVPDKMLELVSELATGTQGSMHRVEVKKLFADATSAEMILDDGTEVELDTNRFLGVFIDGGFGIPFHMDDEVRYHCRVVEVGNDQHIQVAPPEYLAIQKLLSGRGPKEGKFDIYDAVALLNHHAVNYALVEHFIDVQNLDSAFDKNYDSLRSQSLITPELLDQLSIKDEALRAKLLGSVQSRFLPLFRDQDDVANNFEPPLQYAYTFSSLKRIRMIDALITSIQNVRAQFDDKDWDIHGDGNLLALSDIFNRERSFAKLAKLESTLRAKALRVGLLDFWSKEDPDVAPATTNSFRVGLNDLVARLNGERRLMRLALGEDKE